MTRPLPISLDLLRLPGVAYVYQHPDLFGGYMRLCLQVWESGAVDASMADSVCGGADTLHRLVVAKAVKRCKASVTVEWVEELREKELAREKRLAERGKKAAAARWAAPIMRPQDKPANLPITPEVIVERTRADSAVEAVWRRLWQQYRGLDWHGIAKHTINLNKCMKLAKGDLDEVERRATVLLTSQDKWHRESASPEILFSRWNQLGATVTKQASSREDAKTMFDVFKEVK